MSKRKNRKDKSSRDKTDSSVKVALIGAVVTIVAAILGFPPLIAYLTSPPTITNTVSPEPSDTPTAVLQPDTLTPSPSYIDTFTPTLTPTETLTPFPPSAAFTPTAGLSFGMQVSITANPPGGRAPITVKLDARDSFVRAPDGTIFECNRGACKFVWYVTLNGEQVIEPRDTNGTLELKLEKRGNYFVSVYICHGADSPTCASGGTVIPVE